MRWTVWEVHETSHEWIEWVAVERGITKEEALCNLAKNLVDGATKKPISIAPESPYRVCLPAAVAGRRRRCRPSSSPRRTTVVCPA